MKHRADSQVRPLLISNFSFLYDIAKPVDQRLLERIKSRDIREKEIFRNECRAEWMDNFQKCAVAEFGDFSAGLASYTNHIAYAKKVFELENIRLYSSLCNDGRVGEVGSGELSDIRQSLYREHLKGGGCDGIYMVNYLDQDFKRMVGYRLLKTLRCFAGSMRKESDLASINAVVDSFQGLFAKDRPAGDAELCQKAEYLRLKTFFDFCYSRRKDGIYFSSKREEYPCVVLGEGKAIFNEFRLRDGICERREEKATLMAVLNARDGRIGLYLATPGGFTVSRSHWVKDSPTDNTGRGAPYHLRAGARAYYSPKRVLDQGSELGVDSGGIHLTSIEMEFPSYPLLNDLRDRLLAQIGMK